MYGRKLEEDGRVLTLLPSGWAYDNTIVLWDRETGSLWYPDWRGLMSIQGPLFRKRLPKLDSEDTVWKDWQDDYPNSEVINLK